MEKIINVIADTDVNKIIDIDNDADGNAKMNEKILRHKL